MPPDCSGPGSRLPGKIDPQRHQEVAERLAVQVEHAAAWRDHILTYFQGFSGMPINPPAALSGTPASSGA